MKPHKINYSGTGVIGHGKRQKEDLTGRDRLLSNVVWGWGSYVIVVIAGFIMPRLIDSHMGQADLGIWDFSWSLVSYLSYSGMGIGSSINRYVAKYRSQNDIQRLRGAVSSVFFVQNGISLFMIMGGALIALLLPVFFAKKLAEGLSAAQWVVVLLGASLAVDQASSTFRGVITGCHRWDIHNILNASTRLGAFAAMLVVLLLGMRLRALATAYFFTTLGFAVLRALVAFRLCPELKISFTYANLPQAKKMVVFGWKSFVINMSPLLLVQTTNVLVVGVFGPAALAVLSRSVALVRHMATIVNRFSFITTPVASVLKGQRDSKETKNFFCESCRTGVAITLPLVVIFVFFGNTILNIWMGPNYSVGWTLPLLATGYFLPVALSPALNILIGLNRHGKIGFFSLVVTAATFGAGVLLLEKTGWSLPKTAALISIPLIIGNGLIIPLFTASVLKVGLEDFVTSAFLSPILCNIPLAVIFLGCQKIFSENPVMAMLSGLTIGLPLVSVLYLYHVLPFPYREKILEKIRPRKKLSVHPSS